MIVDRDRAAGDDRRRVDSEGTRAACWRGRRHQHRRQVAVLLATLLVAVAALSDAGAGELWKRVPKPAPLPPALKTGLAPVNDIEMYYAVYGAGEPVLLLHGGLGNSSYWGNQVPVLAKQFQVVVADSRGHGRSTRSAQPFGYHLMASDVLALMDHLGIHKAAIVGWSDGGIIGLDLAIHHPERVQKLFAFGANYTTAGLRDDLGDNATFKAYMAGARREYEQLSKTPKQYDAFEAAITKMWSAEPSFTPEQLRAITVPTVIADGEHDEAITRAHTEEMAKLIPGARLVILPGVSHFALLQNPAQFNRAVLDFLRAH